VTIDTRWVAACACAIGVLLAACARGPRAKTSATPETEAWRDLLPAPVSVERGTGVFPIGPGIVIVAPENDAAIRIARQLAELIRRTSGVLPGILSSAEGAAAGRIVLALDSPGSSSGSGATAENYELTIGAQEITLKAPGPAGLFYGAQTIRQLLPYWSEYEALNFAKPRAVSLPAVRIVDRPRFAWRGAMLDVARHFFGVDDVKRYIDLLALHKFNRLHLHLADDQGWRIEIKSWPELAVRGGSREVGGGVGGYFTQQQYADLVAYAAERFITIVPEIDMPGHTNAGLSSYADLNCSGVAPEPYTGTEVGFSALCVSKDVTYKFIDDVVREIAALTPGPYFHAGGDEVKTLTPDQYTQFIERVQTIVESHGKQMVGWDETAAATLLPTSIVQYWRPDAAKNQLQAAPHLILSPANRLYLDMKYDDSTMLGLNWAGNVSVRQAYDWDPAAASGAAAERILGIEAPIWSETLANMRDVEYMAFPRLAAVADLAWAPVARHDWEAFQVRLAAQAPRWMALGINFRRVPEIAWR
jgi:hexosaminidase